MRDYTHHIGSFMPSFVAHEGLRDSWDLTDWDGCPIASYETCNEALDVVRNILYPHLEHFMECSTPVITVFPPGVEKPQNLQNQRRALWLRY